MSMSRHNKACNSANVKPHLTRTEQDKTMSSSGICEAFRLDNFKRNKGKLA